MIPWMKNLIWGMPPPPLPPSVPSPPPPLPPPSPPETFDEAWRPVDWSNEEKQRLLRELNAFQLSTSMVSQVRILLCGPVGSGKSSFINSVNTVLQGRNTTDALADSIGGVSFTVKFKTYKLKKDRVGSFFPFVFSDTMGMEAEISHGIQTNDIISILQGHVQEGYTFNPLTEQTDKQRECDQIPSPDDKVHCLVSILPADKISMMPQSVICEMRKVRQKARDLDIPQVVIMTRVDATCPLVSKDLKMIYRSKKIRDKIEECSNRLGVTKNYIFPVKNYSEEITTNTNVDILILMAMTNIVNFANDFVERECQ